MATPMTPAQSKAAFLAEGLRVVEIPGYQTNDRAPITGRPAGPKHGMVNHHTGGDTSNPYSYAAGILSKGSSALVGPLCHEGLDPDTGTLYMVGTGRTNHAGGGDPAVLAAVKNDAVPYDRELKPTKGNSDGVDGNAPFYGLEVMYSGARDVPRIGYVAMVKWNVARCRFHGWTGASCIAHREWSDDKPDPGHINLPQLRRDVDAALALPPGAWGSSITPPPSGGNDVGTVEGFTGDSLRQLAQYLFEIYNRPWVEPGTQKVGPDNHPAQNFATLLSWNEEYSRRYAQEAQGQNAAALKAATQTIVAAVQAADANDLTPEQVGEMFDEALARAVADGVKVRLELPESGKATPQAIATFAALASDAAPDCAEPSDHNA